MPFSQPRSLERETRIFGEFAGQIGLAFLADERRADYLREAASSRLARQARGPAHTSGMPGEAWRYRAGLAMIRFGGWLQGANDLAPIGAGRRDTFA